MKVERRIYRMPKEMGVWLDSILESHEGLCSFSISPRPKGQPFCDMELQFSPEVVAELEAVLDQIQKSYGEKLTRLL